MRIEFYIKGTMFDKYRSGIPVQVLGEPDGHTIKIIESANKIAYIQGNNWDYTYVCRRVSKYAIFRRNKKASRRKETSG